MTGSSLPGLNWIKLKDGPSRPEGPTKELLESIATSGKQINSSKDL
jgi:hypothetical protein